MLALVAVAVFAVGGIAAGLTLAAERPARGRPTPASVSIERDGLRYEYDAVAGSESLVDLGVARSVRKNLAAARKGDARRLRLLLEAELRVDSLERLHEEHRRDIEELRRLGYL